MPKFALDGNFIHAPKLIKPEAIGCIALAVAAYGYYCVLPIMLSTIAQLRGWSDQQIGWLGSVEMFGMFLGSFTAPWAIRDDRYSLLAGGGLALVLVMLLLSAMVSYFPAFCGVRLLGGFGAGFTYSVSCSRIALTPEAARNFGFLNAMAVFAGAGESFVLPRLVGIGNVNGALLVPVGLCLIAAPFVPMMIVRPAMTSTRRSDGDGPHALHASYLGWLSLLATALCHIAPAALWAYLERLGVSSGVNVGIVATTITVGYFVSALLSLLAGRIGTLLGQYGALLTITALLALDTVSWALPLGGTTGFVLRCLVFNCSWGLLTVYQMSTVGPLDPTGRLVAAVPAAQAVGLALGPLVAAVALGWTGALASAIALTAVFLLASIALSLWIHLHLKAPLGAAHARQRANQG